MQTKDLALLGEQNLYHMIQPLTSTCENEPIRLRKTELLDNVWVALFDYGVTRTRENKTSLSDNNGSLVAFHPIFLQPEEYIISAYHKRFEHGAVFLPGFLVRQHDEIQVDLALLVDYHCSSDNTDSILLQIPNPNPTLLDRLKHVFTIYLSRIEDDDPEDSTALRTAFPIYLTDEPYQIHASHSRIMEHLRTI